MWKFIFVTLALCYGALANDYNDCLVQAERNCEVYSIFPNEFPRNLRELRKDCSNLYKVKRCITGTIENCSLDDANVIDNNILDSELSVREQRLVKDMQRMVDVTSKICDENSELHRDFVPYLSCIRKTFELDFEKQVCRDYTNNAIELIRNRIDGKARAASGSDDKFIEVRREITDCLRVLLSMNCVVTQSMKRCDSGVKQPILDIIRKGGSLYYQCPASTRIDVLELLDAMDQVTRQKIYVRRLIKVNSLA